jgi:hypothetical protein
VHGSPDLLDCSSRAQPKGRANSPGPRPIDPGTATPSHAGCNSGRPQSPGRRCSSTLAGRLKTRFLWSHPSTLTTLISVFGRASWSGRGSSSPRLRRAPGSGGFPEPFASFPNRTSTFAAERGEARGPDRTRARAGRGLASQRRGGRSERSGSSNTALNLLLSLPLREVRVSSSRTTVRRQGSTVSQI